MDYINKLYDNISYLDQYGTAVLYFIILTIFVCLIFAYCRIIQSRQAIADDWVNQRCKPQNMPFAGWINAPEGKDTMEYTNENFQYCVQNIMVELTGFMTQPLNYIVSALSSSFGELSDSVNSSRGFLDILRTNIQTFTEEVMARILNIVIPLQRVFIALIDTFQKAQGIFTASLYTMLGSYYTLQTLLGAIMELIIKILIIMAALIIGLWALPFTWPAAASMSAVFLTISIPMAIIVAFMSEVMHIHPSMSIPKLHKPKLRCFDKNTGVRLNNGHICRICDIHVGDILENGSAVTACIKLASEDLRMFKINGVIVSESHRIIYKDKWIYCSKHPDAIELMYYGEKYIYCLNTTCKYLELNNMIFMDWDEL